MYIICMCNWVTMLYSREKNYIGEIIKKRERENLAWWPVIGTKCITGLQICLKKKKSHISNSSKERVSQN